MSSTEKIVQYHISRLKNRGVDVQLEALRELMSLGAQAEKALPALQEVYETSENEQVRKAAQRVAQLIYTKVREAKSQGES